MVRRFYATKGWILISVTVMSSAIIIVMYDRLRAAEKNLANYRLAISCPSKDNCREKFEATVVKSHSQKIYFGGKGQSFINTVYIFSISSAIGNQTIEISAYPPTVGIPFDIGNVRTPPDTGAKFIKENFYDGETVF